jgi:hypothetical protein
MKVTGRPIAILKPDSTTQERDTTIEFAPHYVYDSNHKFTVFRNIEVGQVVAFIGTED